MQNMLGFAYLCLKLLKKLSKMYTEISWKATILWTFLSTQSMVCVKKFKKLCLMFYRLSWKTTTIF